MEDNTGIRIRGDANSVTGDLQFNRNTSTGGTFPNIVANNTVGENLQCSGNTPAASIGTFGLNTVTGVAEGECATLV